MEERLVDKEDERLIRIKKKAEGTDAEDALAEEGEEIEEEVLVSLPEEDAEDEEYDEDLVGLTATELKRELQRRKKLEDEARIEYDKLVASAEEELQRGDCDKAATLLEQAACYPFADEKLGERLWTARTKNFTDTAPFYQMKYAEEFSAESDQTKRLVREQAGAALRKERAELEKEEAELAPQVLEKQATRRQAFAQNRKYYCLRLIVFAGLMVLFAIAAGISAAYIVRTLSNLPIIFTGIFGGLTLISFIVALVFFMKYSGANKLCRLNDKLSSTQEGARLVELRNRLECLKLILED